MKIAKIAGLVLLFGALICLVIYASIRPSASAWRAATRLQTTDIFGFGPRGNGGTISDSEIDFYHILQNNKSHLVFRQVFDNGTPEARAFAIIGLKQSLIGRTDDRIDQFLASDVTFQAQSGCILSDGFRPADLFADWDQTSFEEYIALWPDRFHEAQQIAPLQPTTLSESK